MKQDRYSKIYKDYTDRPKGVKVEDIAKKHGIAKSGLYHVIKTVEKGNLSKITRCTKRSRLLCLWEYKYKRRYNLIPKSRKPEAVKVFRKLVLDMTKDGFKSTDIAKYLSKDRTTILYHVNNLSKNL